MQPASDQTVLGTFNDATFADGAITTTFHRSGSKFLIRTAGADGNIHDYAVKYTFGVFPLQQYLIEMPGGRLQAFGIAWDTRPRDKGGQRWYSLNPGQGIKAGNPLHWTGIDQNWNSMCADCHSTNVRKNYDAQRRTYSTAYAEIDVACEACHGPGSEHIAWAKRQGDWKAHEAGKGLLIGLDERRGVSWAVVPESGEVRRSRPRGSEREIQMCARCHSRRSQIHEDYVHGQPAGDDYRIALLDPDLYFPDGQIKGEDYEYGSFIQSRMFHAGVTCSDCHEPHSQKLRVSGNGLCLQCHLARKYDTQKHHFHKTGSEGARCVNCHMPARTYMVVDARRDHSLRVPRPDLSVKLGVPNACTECHTDKAPQWASDAVVKWYGSGPTGFQHFAETLHGEIEGAPSAWQSVTGLIAGREQPAIARATALSILSGYAPPPTDQSIRVGVEDDSALVRRGAARALANSDASAAVPVLAPLLLDPVRAVRLETGEVLAGAPSDAVTPRVAPGLKKAVGEYVTAQELNADRPEAHLNLGLLDEKQNQPGAAEAEFKTALSLDPAFTPAAVNLADLYRQQNRDQEGEQILADAIRRTPDDASLQHALGLVMVREKHYSRALELLSRATQLNPADARYAYVYAIALNDSGQTKAAIAALEASVKLHPYDRASLEALVALMGQSGDTTRELVYAQRLAEFEPDNAKLQQLIARLRGAAGQ